MNLQFSKRTWFDDYYILCMIPMAMLILYYNFNAKTMLGILPSYQAFAQVIRAGFDTSVTSYYPLTFPMWGYGFLMAITQNHLALLLMQLTLAFVSIWYFINTLEKYNLLPNAYIRFFKFLLLISVPWYAFHTVRWPYSIASSLLIVSLSLLYRSTQEQKWLPYILFSALAFGLLLNFRSDYILMPIGLAAIFLYFQLTFNSLKKMFLWMALMYSCLAPWALFTKEICGHYLISSTNSGHFLISSLGEYPSNKWGLTCKDNCPVTHKLITNAFGKNAITWDYKGSSLLKEKFWEYIKDSPNEYFKKMHYSFIHMMKLGLYQGQFFLKNLSNNLFKDNNKTIFKKMFSANPPQAMDIIAIFLQRFSYFFGKYLLIANILILPFAGLLALYLHNLFFTFIVAITVYQVTLIVLGHNLSGYTSNIFIFLLLIPCYLVSSFLQIKRSIKNEQISYS
jgi:hypothetical protein